MTAPEVASFLEGCPANVRRLVQRLRALVRSCAPRATEALKFHALCYFVPGTPFGAIGGNVCMIEIRPAGVRLSFLQGARLSDPDGLLQGRGKAKRHVDILSPGDLRGNAIQDLIRASARRRLPD
jgi:hypothetical protein